jgi:beta-galactosidase
VHVVSAETADLSAYKLVIAPTLHLPSVAVTERLAAYAENGGHLILGVRSGFKTESNRVTDQPLPGRLRDLVGATVSDWQSLPDGVSWELDPQIPFLRGAATYWVERLTLDSARPLVRYKHDRSVAMTENAVGAGRVVYLGWYPIPNDMEELMAFFTRRLGISSGEKLPDGLQLIRRGPHSIFMNFSDNIQTTTLNGRPITLAARDVTVLTNSAE